MRRAERKQLVELGLRKRREPDEPDEDAPSPPPVKRLASGPTIIHTPVDPALSFAFDIQLGGFAISNGGSCTLPGVLFFPRIKGDKASFALALPNEVSAARLAWVANADADLRASLGKAGIHAEVLPKMKTWDGAPGISLINFYGDDFPWMDGNDDEPKISTFSESINAVHGTPIVVLARVGTKTSTSTTKTGEVVVSWPLYAQGIRLYPNPPQYLLDLKNSTKPGVAFPAIPKG